MRKGKKSEVRGRERGVAIYCLRSALPPHILESLTTYYEKNCFVLNHGLNRHRICHFLRTKAGNNGNLDRTGDYESLTVAYTEETHSQEESAQDRGIAIHHRVACAYALKEKQKFATANLSFGGLEDRGQKAEGT